jgi:hypothetical protein
MSPCSNNEFVRRPDGSIDIEHYSHEALQARRVFIGDLWRRLFRRRPRQSRAAAPCVAIMMRGA